MVKMSHNKGTKGDAIPPRCSTTEIPLSHDCSRRSRREVDTSPFPKMKSPAGFLQSKDFAFDRQPPLSKWKRGDAERQKR